MVFARNCLVYLLACLGFYGPYSYASGKPSRSYALWPASGVLIPFAMLMYVARYTRLNSLLIRGSREKVIEDLKIKLLTQAGLSSRLALPVMVALLLFIKRR
jgi:hypothetical protein